MQFTPLRAQPVSQTKEKLWIVTDTLFTPDSLSIIPESIRIKHRQNEVQPNKWSFNSEKNTILINREYLGDTLLLYYQTFSWNWQQDIFVLDTHLINTFNKPITNFRAPITGTRKNAFGSQLDKQGSITRGVVVGNGQNASVNSDLNLQINGELGPQLYIRANITDRNIPVQPEGNTQRIQEFDQVFIEVYNDKHRVLGGDFEQENGISVFLKYRKRARGLVVEPNAFDTTASYRGKTFAGISRGKFSRNELLGIEGNQGPYRLRGSDNETFIVVVAGTERVYVNGVPLARGQDRDYIIDYNNAEITFTANHLITKDSRIIVEFQYADQQFARSLLVSENEYKTKHWTFFSKYYQEQDAKNQPLQFDISDDIKNELAQAGDPRFSNNGVLINGFENAAFDENLVLYELIDSLGYDSIFVNSTDNSKQLYTVRFTQVNQGEGDYILTNPLANGRVFAWVAPDTINNQVIRQGNYVPKVLLTPPQQQRMFTNGFSFRKNGWLMNGELAYTLFDKNTFSSLDQNDDEGYAYKIGAAKQWKNSKTSSWKVGANYAEQDEHFSPIERFRSVEFNRDWNLINVGDSLPDIRELEGFVSYANDSLGNIQLSAEQLIIPQIIEGNKGNINWNFNRDKWTSKATVSGLNNQLSNRYFVRHLSSHSYQIGTWDLSYKDEREENVQQEMNDSLTSSSYQFYWWRGTLTHEWDRNKKLSFFGGRRTDRIASGTFLKKAAVADEAGVRLDLKELAQHNVNATLQYRQLNIADSTLINQEPEATLVWQLGYQGRLFDGLIQQQAFAASNTGLERKQLFQFVQVPIGQGIYSYTDFNNNQIQELDEFYISPFPYEANYIKIFLPTNEYVSATEANLTYQLSLQPSARWLNAKDWKKFLARFSSLHSFKYLTKVNGKNAINELFKEQVDGLLSENNMMLHRLSYNAFDPDFGSQISYSTNDNTQLLTDGFQQRNTLKTELTIRKRWFKLLTSTFTLIQGEEEVSSDLLQQQNFGFSTKGIKPELNLPINKNSQLVIKGSWLNKTTKEKQEVSLRTITLEGQLVGKKIGNINLTAGLVEGIGSQDISNGNLRLTLLEGFSEGLNYTWGVSAQQQISNNLQLTLNYQARATKKVPTVHVGTLQVRAFF